jgi:hypothetical protein
MVLILCGATVLLGRASVESASSRRDPDPDSQRYNESILTALGEYSSSLPNFQVSFVRLFRIHATRTIIGTFKEDYNFYQA